MKNAYGHFRTLKHIHGIYIITPALILNSHHSNIKTKLGKGIINACKIHTVKEEALGGGPKGRVKRRTRREKMNLTQYLMRLRYDKTALLD